MSKIKFEAVVRDRGSLIGIGSINSVKLSPLIGKHVKVTVTVVPEPFCPICGGIKSNPINGCLSWWHDELGGL